MEEYMRFNLNAFSATGVAGVSEAGRHQARAGTAIRRPARLLAIAAALCLPAAHAADGPREAHNKALVLTFYQQLFGDKDVSAIERYVAEGYIQHNPTVPTGRAAIQQLFAKVFAGAPRTKVDVRRIAADGDLVWLHVRAPGPDGRVSAIVDIFRVEGERIVEHWDVIQTVPEKAANENTMF
jgi:predicted SnoaL-like aldol condensation-catalyzing enzyme